MINTFLKKIDVKDGDTLAKTIALLPTVFPQWVSEINAKVFNNRQRDCATRLSIQILQLQNIPF